MFPRDPLFRPECLASVVQFKLVANTPNGFDLPLLGHTLQFFTQALDVHVYSTGITEIIKAPHIVQQLGTGKNTVAGRCVGL